MMHGSGLGLWWVWPLVLVVGVVALVWGVARASSSGGSAPSPGSGRAREILQERFARGELTEQELRERMRVLDEQ